MLHTKSTGSSKSALPDKEAVFVEGERLRPPVVGVFALGEVVVDQV